MTVRPALVGTIALVTASFAACGGDVSAFGDSGGGGQGTSTSSSGDGGSSNGGAGGGVGGASVSSSSGNGGAGASGGGGGGTGGSPTTVSSSSSGGGGVINCGDVTCDAATQECCGTQNGTSCISIGDSCMGLTLSCSSAANCPGNEVCCMEFQMGQAPTAQCEAMCQGGGPGGPIQLCTTAAECPNNEPCEEAFGGFFVCGGGFP